MTHRERVRTAIQHKEPDRVPVGEWLIDKNLMARILKKDVKTLDLFSDTVKVCELLGLDLKG